MDKDRPTSSSGRGWRSHGRLNPDTSRESDINPPPRLFKPKVGGGVIGYILAGVGLNPSLPPNRIGDDWATPTCGRSAPRQVHPSPQNHDNNEVTVMAPALRMHSGTIPSRESTGSHHYSWTSTGAPPAPSRSWPTCSRLVRSCSSAHWRFWERRISMGSTTCVCSQPMYRLPVVRSGSCAQARSGGDGRATRNWHSRRTGHVVEPIWRRLA